MSLLIYAGLLYLLGVSIVLMIKPELMFTPDGVWKEFGLGRSKMKYTWMPFWLFSILWAILSYLLILIVASHTGLGGIKSSPDITVPNQNIEPEQVSTTSMNSIKRKPKSDLDMKSGYYILDPNSSDIPKYVYLGRDIPNLIYHRMEE
jgi:hypothetical protein